MINWDQKTIRDLERIRQIKPLIHNLTNFVVMNSTANVILATGASPVMSHAREEVEEMASKANAVVLNIGTLEPDWIESMILAGKTANKYGIPVIFDPVGVGATRYRYESAHKIIERVNCDIIRGNASEVLSLAGFNVAIKGVDSLVSMENLTAKILEISQKFGTVIAVTGVEDLVCDGNRCLGIRGGDPIFKKVTGTGCAASAICACFAAVNENAVEASAEALAFYGIAGKEAAIQAEGPGTFQVKLIDVLATLDFKTIKNSVMVREI